VKNLTVNGNVGSVAIPAGVYGELTVNSQNTIVLGVVGATTPSVYNFQSLKLNGNSTVQVVGPVVITTAGDVSMNSSVGSTANPEWLTVKIYNGDFTLNGNSSASAMIIAPTGKITISGNSTLTGGLAADDLTLNGNNSKLKVTKSVPTP
jgi:rhamnogalacturonan endolyase